MARAAPCRRRMSGWHPLHPGPGGTASGSGGDSAELLSKRSRRRAGGDGASSWIDSDGQSTAATPPPAEAARSSSPTRLRAEFVIGAEPLRPAAALAVAELPGQAYNPLFLHGPPGIGKTHLAAGDRQLHHRSTTDAIDRPLRDRRDIHERVHAAAAQPTTMTRFKQRYRQAPTSCSSTTSSSSKQAPHRRRVLPHVRRAATTRRPDRAHSRPPAGRDPKLHDRLRDRFEAGLVVELEPPDFDTRLAILEAAAGGDEPTANRGARAAGARVVAQHPDPRGRLIRARAFASLTEQPLTPDVAEPRALEHRTATTSGTGLPNAHRRADPGGDVTGVWTLASPTCTSAKAQPSGRLCSPGRHVPLPRAHRPSRSRRSRQQIRRP